MDFWPKRWGGRNFDGDKGLGTVQTLGLPFSKQVNGNTTARKIGEFSETVIEEDEPAYYISGYVQRGGLIRFETYTSEDYRGGFTRYNSPVYGPLGAGEYWYSLVENISPGGLNALSSGGATAYEWKTTLSFVKGLRSRSAASAEFQTYALGFAALATIPGADQPITGATRHLVFGATGYGNGPSRLAVATHGYGMSTNHWGDEICGLKLIRASRLGGATYTAIPSLPGMNKCNLCLAAFATFSPDSFVMLVACTFSPHPYNAAYQGGDLYLYTTNDGGATFYIAPLTALNADLPAPPDLRNPADTPEGYLRLPADFVCNRNRALSNITLSAQIAVCTPTKWFMSFVSYKSVGGTWKNVGEMYVTSNAGASWTPVAFPALLEVHTPEKPTRVVYATYLGQGRMIAKTRSTVVGNNNLWNLIRSENYGASWTCIPKVGLPTDTAPFSFHTGNFKVLRKRTTTQTAIVVFTAWNGSAYTLYESKDEGFTWRRVAKLSNSEVVYGMEEDIGDGDLMSSFANLLYLGTEDEPAPLSVETPWQYDRRITYEEE